MSRIRKAVVLGLAIGLLGVALRPTPAGVRLEEDLALRWLFAVRGPIDAPPEVAVVSIDKASSDQLGLTKEDWPPSRHIHASIIHSLSRHGVSAIMMDVFFRRPPDCRRRRRPGGRDRQSGNVGLFEWRGPDQIRRRRGRPDPLAHRAVEECGACDRRVSAARGRRRSGFFGRSSTPRRKGADAARRGSADPCAALPRSVYLAARASRIGDLTDLPSRVATFRDSRQLMTCSGARFGSHPDAARRALGLLERGRSRG